MEKLRGNYRRYRFQSLAAIEAGERGETDPFQKGYDEGFAQGLERGLAQGLEDGRAQGEPRGYEEGYRKGYQEGREAGEQTFVRALEPVQRVQQALETLRQQELSEQAEHICSLVEQVARRAIHAELSLNPEQIQKLVEDALSRMDTRKGDITIFLSGADYQNLAKTGINRIGGYPIQVDDTLASGDCRLESEQQQQTIHAEERLQKCVAKVREELQEERDE